MSNKKDWCKHIKRREDMGGWELIDGSELSRTGWAYFPTGYWHFCPICGEKNPDEDLPILVAKQTKI